MEKVMTPRKCSSLAGVFLVVLLAVGSSGWSGGSAPTPPPSAIRVSLSEATGAVQEGATVPKAIPKAASPARLDQASRTRFIRDYLKSALSFELNQGQADGQVKFISRGPGYSLSLISGAALFSFRRHTPGPDSGPGLFDVAHVSNPLARSAGSVPFSLFQAAPHNEARAASQASAGALRLELLGANPSARLSGLDELPGKTNYFIGNDPKRWLTNVPNYSRVKYQDVYPGVDLVYYGKQQQLEFDCVVEPNADLKTIRFAMEGATKLALDARGDLLIETGAGEVRLRKPIVYQLNSAQKPSVQNRQFLQGRYVLHISTLKSEVKNPEYEVGFEVPSYDHTRPLVIDPVLAYSSYLGGDMDDFGNAIAVDGSGNIYVAGGTTSGNFPTTSGVVQAHYAGADGGYQSVNGDIFVAKLNPSGSALLYSTYLGGSGDDNAYGIVVDTAGNVYLTGGTNSADFPMTPGAYQPSSGGLTDFFVTKLNATGSALLYSTHVGVFDEGIRGFGIAVDRTGSAYITGNAGPGFPTTSGAFQTGTSAFTVGYVTKLDPTGSRATYSTLLGGSRIDYGESIAVDAAGNAYVTGAATSADFPTTKGGFQTTPGGGVDAFVTVLNPTGSGLIYSTFLGGSGNDEGLTIAVDSSSSGKAYVTGVTGSSGFPTTSGALQTTFGGGNTNPGGGDTDAFVAKFDTKQSGPSSLVYSTFLGGSGDENTQNFIRNILAVDSAGNAYVTGITTSFNFPTVNPIAAVVHGGDAYVAKLNAAGSGLIYSTYLAGNGNDVGRGIAVDSSGNVYVTGETSSGFPTTTGALQTSFGGGNTDAFVAKIVPVASLSQTGLMFGSQLLGSTSATQTITLTNERNTSLNIAGLSSSGDFAETNTCGASLAAGQKCTIEVSFTPTGGGNRSGTVTVTDDAVNSPQVINIGGTGTDFSVVAAPGSSSATVTAGQSATYALTLAPLGGFSQTVATSCMGAPLRSICTVSPSSVMLDGTHAASINVTLSTTAATFLLRGAPQIPPIAYAAVLLSFLLLTAFAVLSMCRKLGRQATYLVLGLILASLTLLAACSGAGSSAHNPGTTTGTYTLVITGSSSSITHTTNLSLNVQ